MGDYKEKLYELQSDRNYLSKMLQKKAKKVEITKKLLLKMHKENIDLRASILRQENVIK
jgi:hypothetical protein